MQKTVVITGKIVGNQIKSDWDYASNRDTTSVSSTVRFDKNQPLVSEYQSLQLNEEFPLNTSVKITFVVGNEDQ